MPLTPEDVSNKRFTPVRLREGYDMGEVDQFLDEVEAELERLSRENEDLRSKLAAAQSGAPVAAPIPESNAPQARDEPEASTSTGSFGAVDPEPAAADSPSTGAPDLSEFNQAAEPEVPVEPQAPAQPEPSANVAPAAEAPVGQSSAAVPAAQMPPPSQTIRVETVSDASNAAARLLEIATRNADQVVEDAKDEADGIVGAARTKAERLDAESQSAASQIEQDARARAEMLDSETQERRQEVLGELEKEREQLNSEVENLRSFEREYRSRLKSYFTQQLESLSQSATAESGTLGAPNQSAPAQPKRLRTILGEDEG